MKTLYWLCVFATGYVYLSEAAIGAALSEKVFLEISQNSQENNCARVSFLIKLQAEACNFTGKETLAQVFSCEFCKIFNCNSFYRIPPVAASVFYNILWLRFSQRQLFTSSITELEINRFLVNPFTIVVFYP